MQGNFLDIKGTLIKLDEAISLELNSPFFDRENKILSNGSNINPQGTIAPSFTNFSDADLKKALGNIDLLSAKLQPDEIAGVSLISNGIRIDTGNLQILQINKNENTRLGKYSLQFYSGDWDNFLKTVKDKKLTDLVMGGDIAIAGGNISNWGNINPYVSGDPVLGANLINLQVNNSPPSSPPNPMTYNDVFVDDYYNQHAKTSDFAATVTLTGHDYVCFPSLVVFGTEKDEQGNLKWRMVNRWNADAERYITYSSQVISGENFSYTAYRQVDNPIVPMYYYHQVLKHCFSEFGYTLNDDWLLDDESFLKLAFFNTHNILKPLMVNMTNIHNQGSDDNTLYYEQSTTIQAKNHLPDMAITNFLSDFMLSYNCYFDVQGLSVTIKHNELAKIQREIKRIAPDIEIHPQKDKGLNLKYNLDQNDAYLVEKAFQKTYSSLPDIDDVGTLSNNDWYIDHERNYIYKKLAGDDELQGSNLINFYSGSGAKQYVMDITPVNCKTFPYGKITGTANNAFLPFVHNDITGDTLKTFYYEFGSEDPINYGALGYAWVLTHNYTYVDLDDTQYSDPSPLSMMGFYHGLMQTLDLVTSGKDYPYASFHNYAPGAASPKIGDWHLGILGAEGLIDTFWGIFVNIFMGRKAIIPCDEHHFNIRDHEWNQSVLIRGQRMYISIMRPSYPITQFPIYECYELDL